MALYKLYKQINRNKKPLFEIVNISSVRGLDCYTFGMEINPDEYRQYEKVVWKYIMKNSIIQHIMTESKYLSIIENSPALQITIKKIEFNFNPEYYEEFISDLMNNRLTKDNILSEVRGFIDEGAEIKVMSVMLPKSTDIIRIYNTGCIYFNSNINTENLYFKKLLTYLITGKLVENETNF